MDVYDEIRAEREHQRRRWGPEADRQDDARNTPWMWCAYVAQYSTRWMGGGFAPIGAEATDAFRRAMVKVAAIAVAAVESVDRQRAGDSGRAFYE